MGPSLSSFLRIGGDPSNASGSGRTGGASDRLTGVVLRDAPGEPPFPLDKDKGKIEEIKYPGGSEYLKSSVQNALAVGPSRIEPLYGATFARRNRPLLVSGLVSRHFDFLRGPNAQDGVFLRGGL